MERVKGKVALITGGAKGLGKAASLRLAEAGARVAVTDVDSAAGEQVVREITEAGGTAAYWDLDVTDGEAVKTVFEQVRDRFGGLDVLVNNAGISGVDKPTHEVTEEEWDHVMDVNVKGVFLCTKYAVPYMKTGGGGSIINLSSVYGLVGAANVPPYHASKGAVRLMTKTDALLYAQDKIRVNSVHPGFIRTPMVENFTSEQPAGQEETQKALASLHPLGHLGEPDDIAWGIVYLASDESKFVTGSELVIDGGYTAQ